MMVDDMNFILVAMMSSLQNLFTENESSGVCVYCVCAYHMNTHTVQGRVINPLCTCLCVCMHSSIDYCKAVIVHMPVFHDFCTLRKTTKLQLSNIDNAL